MVSLALQWMQQALCAGPLSCQVCSIRRQEKHRYLSAEYDVLHARELLAILKEVNIIVQFWLPCS